MEIEINILKEFLNMPLENTDAVFDKFTDLPGAIRRGRGLEQFLFIEGKRDNKVLLVAHADTKWDENYGASNTKPKVIYCDNGKIKNRNGGLGADDRAGCAIIYLLKDMGHSILITSGEEDGQRGSKWLMEYYKNISDKINNEHQFVIQLDRKGKRDFKCYDVGTDNFRKYIKNITGYEEPDRRSATDIKVICQKICGVNLSIGYYNNHQDDEYLEIK